uniref:Uncharacterized protein n=1 Tax=Panagrolaimus sp. PS1159 TaxID=55785 RepID=A0AC35FG52_9BILA
MITDSSICGIHIKTLSKTYSILGSFGSLFFFAVAKLFSFLSINIFLLLFSNFVGYIFALNGTIKEKPFQFIVAQILLLPNIGMAFYWLSLAKKAMNFQFMATWGYALSILAGGIIVYTLFIIFVFHRTRRFLEKEEERRRE